MKIQDLLAVYRDQLRNFAIHMGIRISNVLAGDFDRAFAGYADQTCASLEAAVHNLESQALVEDEGPAATALRISIRNELIRNRKHTGPLTDDERHAIISQVNQEVYKHLPAFFANLEGDYRKIKDALARYLPLMQRIEHVEGKFLPIDMQLRYPNGIRSNADVVSDSEPGHPFSDFTILVEEKENIQNNAELTIRQCAITETGPLYAVTFVDKQPNGCVVQTTFETNGVVISGMNTFVAFNMLEFTAHRGAHKHFDIEKFLRTLSRTDQREEYVSYSLKCSDDIRETTSQFYNEVIGKKVPELLAEYHEKPEEKRSRVFGWRVLMDLEIAGFKITKVVGDAVGITQLVLNHPSYGRERRVSFDQMALDDVNTGRAGPLYVCIHEPSGTRYVFNASQWAEILKAVLKAKGPLSLSEWYDRGEPNPETTE